MPGESRFTPRARSIVLAAAVAAAGAFGIWLRSPGTDAVRASAGSPDVAAPADSALTPAMPTTVDDRRSESRRALDAIAIDAEDIAERERPNVSPDSADADFAERWGEPTPALVRASIEAVVADVFLDRRLTAAEIERATAALLELRTARAELDALPMEPAHAARRRALIEALGRASEAFHAVMDMSPSEFTARAADATAHAAGGAAAGGGIDRDVEPDYVPDDDFLVPHDGTGIEP